MNGWHAATRHESTVASTGHPVGGRLLAQFAIDLTASVLVVLTFGWFFAGSVSNANLHAAVVTQNAIYAAISRFTPQQLVLRYISTVDHLTSNTAYSFQVASNFTGTIDHALVAVGRLMVGIALAIPQTLLELFSETSATAARTVSVAFGMALGGVFVALFINRTSLWRLLFAAAISPLAISVLFLALQGCMVAILGIFYWFTSLVLYTIACPILCTIYWLVFPNAERGATASLARAMLRLLESGRNRRKIPHRAIR